MSIKLLLCILLSLLSRSHQKSVDYVNESLKRNLMTNYNSNNLPISDPNAGVFVINLNLMVTHVNIIESQSIMETFGILEIGWRDYRLQWNEKLFDNITKVHLVDSTLWHPTLFVKNNLRSNHRQQYGTTIMTVTNQGYVRWLAPVEIKTLCDLTLHNWPYDSHTCDVTFAPATFMDPRVILHVDELIGPSDTRIVKSSQWRVNKALSISNANTTFREISFQFELERSPDLIVQTFLRPFITFVIFIIAMFLLPMKVEFRISSNCILICMLIIMLVYYNAMFAINLPTPYIIQCCYVTLFFLTISTILEVFRFTVIQCDSMMSKIPKFAESYLIESNFAILLSGNLRKLKIKNFEVPNDMIELVESNDTQNGLQTDTNKMKWLSVLHCLNNSLFLIYFVYLVIMNCAYVLWII